MSCQVGGGGGASCLSGGVVEVVGGVTQVRGAIRDAPPLLPLPVLPLFILTAATSLAKHASSRWKGHTNTHVITEMSGKVKQSKGRATLLPKCLKN